MAGKGPATLVFAVRIRVVVWLLGQLFKTLVGLALFPLGAALIYQDLEFAMRCAIVASLFLGAGWAMARIEAPRDVRPNEAMLSTALVFLVAAIAMTWPFVGEGLHPLDAWFESVSAITTTGLTTVADVQSRSPTFLLTRAWIQWYGGLAIVVLAVALVLAPGLATRRLGQTEAELTDIVGSTRNRARQAFAVYVLLTAAAFALMMIAGISPFDALAHAFAAVSTGGFSTHNDAVLGLGAVPVQWIPIAISFCGAITLTFYVRIRQGHWQSAVRDPDLHALVLTMLISAALISTFLVTIDGLSFSEAIRQGPLVAVSAQTTSGFSSIDVGGLSSASKLVLIGSMFVGGDTGSTAGGIKITRLLIMLALIRLVIMRTRLPPHAVSEPSLAGRRLENEEVYAALTVVMLHALVILLSWLIFVASGYEPLDSLFDVTSAVGTVGLSAGVVDESLTSGLKWLLTADMFMGRLEVVAVIVLLYPPTWFGRRAEVS